MASICSSMSGTVGISRSAICLRIIRVANAVMPGKAVRLCGIDFQRHPARTDPACWMCIAVLPTGVNFRSCMVDLLIMSKPQNVKNRWVSMPSPRAALAMTKAG